MPYVLTTSSILATKKFIISYQNKVAKHVTIKCAIPEVARPENVL